MMVGAYRPQLHIQPVYRGHTSRSPVSYGSSSKVSSRLLTALGLSHLIHLVDDPILMQLGVRFLHFYQVSHLSQ